MLEFAFIFIQVTCVVATFILIYIGVGGLNEGKFVAIKFWAIIGLSSFITAYVLSFGAIAYSCIQILSLVFFVGAVYCTYSYLDEISKEKEKK